ncbi:hypothetical protein ACKVEX_14140 [Rhodocyclaceae bacterium SMB388]
MNATTDLDHLISQAISHNGSILRGDRMLEALADDTDHLPADIIRTGRAQAALRAAQNRPDQPLPADQIKAIHRAADDIRRRLRG